MRRLWREAVGLFRVPLAISYVCVVCGRTRNSLSRAQYKAYRRDHAVICRCGQIMCIRSPQAIASRDTR